jgi:carbon starvation protein
MLWIVFLFVYTFFASSLPVWLLLQPRDFLNGIQLIIILSGLYMGVILLQPQVVAPAVNFNPPGAPSIFPFLFITIACGALSGFHALVSSGTTSKQLDKEKDARTVGYLGFLGESSLAVAVIIACTAGIAIFGMDKFSQIYGSWGDAKKGALLAVVEGGSNLLTALGISKELGITMISTMVVLFSATTMDTSVRIQRYILGELGSSYGFKILSNKWLASAVAVITSMALVLSKEGGKGGMIFWPIFGAANQILAALALLVTIVYLRSVKRPVKPFLIPLVGVLVITSVAMFLNLINNLSQGDYLLASVSGLILILEFMIVLESARALVGKSYGVET